ncbi:hypothetical protein AAVH_23816 [Aphelenchoides avenae]|nr:hypothetical protein AAVH_23816 [Aphelenchus avenae]
MFHAPRMRPPFGNQYGNQYGWQSSPREGWVRLSKQLKIDLNIAPGDETDGDLADKLNDPAEPQRILKLINCRRLSGVGRVSIHTAFGWDGPANETSSLDDPGKTVEEYYRDAGHVLKAAQHKVLLVKVKKDDTEFKQSPLEYTWTLAPLTANKGESVKPMPGWGNSSKAVQNGSENKGIKVNEPSADNGHKQCIQEVIKEQADVQMMELQGIKNGIDDLKNMVKMEIELKARIDQLEADNATQGKQLQMKEAEAAHLRSIVDYYKEAAPKVQLPAHYIIERILDGGEKSTTVAAHKRKEDGGAPNELKAKNARHS